MDVRYKSVVLQRFSAGTKKLLLRLADPAVGKRVRFLTASPDFQFYGAVASPPSFGDRINILQHVLHSFRRSRFDHVLRPEKEGTIALINALPVMSNVMAFTVDSHSWGEHSGPELNTFLNTAWTSFSSNLKKLSLRGHAASFRTIIASKPSLPKVEELFFELIDSPSSPSDIEDVADILLTVFAPFINSFTPKLQALTFWALIDVLLPNLQSLRLNLRELDVGVFTILAVPPDIHTFISELKARIFIEWKLRNIGVWQVFGASVTQIQIHH
ncbi:hypothetical protein LENED_012431 [Lentinula edodes]|uniref:Uncharacterized protein n=1 Tax=Lentinula edodes TaxID=5353 RepID=A0A1Q3ESJ7_LENED|nr:hypothetical protein LENED_012431 [Lentinula edodes]